MRPVRRVLDVSELPEVVMGSRDLMWWGTLGFMVIEGTTLILAMLSYLYLSRNFDGWPPYGTPDPSLGVPIAQMITMAVSIPVLVWMEKGAHRFELGRVRWGLLVATLLKSAFVALRWFELVALNVKWDTNAYGSAQWLLVLSHATLLLIELLEVGGMAALFWMGPVEKKHFSDAADLAFYWYFMVGIWVPIFILSYLVPRWM
jgi:cytochrome c oxidase subunit I+III